MMKNIINYIKQLSDSMSLRAKLIISYLFLIVLPSMVLGFGYYNTSSRIVFQNTENNIAEILKKNNEIIDEKFDNIEKQSASIIIDPELFKIFNDANHKTPVELLEMDREISNILSKYFVLSPDIYSLNLLTSYFIFGNNIIHLSPRQAIGSQLYRAAYAGRGQLIWFPTYDFVDMFNQTNLGNSNIDYRYLFSAVRWLNCSNAQNGVVREMEQNVERPILLITFKEDFFDVIFQNSFPVAGAYYYILTKDGRIISDSDHKELAKWAAPEIVAAISKGENGIDSVVLNDQKMLIWYDTLKTTGWVSVVLIPVNNILKGLPFIRFFTFYIGISLIFLSVILAYVIAGRITAPINRLLDAMKETGEGNFEIKVPITGNDEIGVLIKKFNDMNYRIKQLIKENYEAQLREKEAHIMALNFQLNPHFLYNTLNVINWMAIENDQKEISKMLISLSTMLQYTLKNDHEMVLFKEDLEWLKSYVHILKTRYDEKFEVYYDIDPALELHKVPKLFLQPFVENAVLHGFKNMDHGGIIEICGWIDADKRYFTITDNGEGMDAEKINEIFEVETSKIGVKNTNRRIKLIYGEEYGVDLRSEIGKGTIVTIILPLQEEK